MKAIHNLKEYRKAVRKKRFLILAVQIFLFCFFFALWELAARMNWINPFLVSQPSAIVRLFVTYVRSGTLRAHVRISAMKQMRDDDSFPGIRRANSFSAGGRHG